MACGAGAASLGEQGRIAWHHGAVVEAVNLYAQQAADWRVYVPQREVHGPARGVLIVLADHANEAGEAWPSMRTLVAESGYSNGTVGEGGSPSARTVNLKRLEDDALIFTSAHGVVLGCLVGNLSLELSSNSEPIRTQLMGILERWGSALAQCLRSGDLREGLDADDVASRLIEAWEGAVLRGKMIRSRIPYDRFEADTIPALLLSHKTKEANGYGHK